MKSQEMHQENIPIAVVGINHHRADVSIREKVTFNDRQQTAILKQLARNYKTRGAIVLSTCNRTEIYMCGRKAIKYIGDICTWLDSITKEHIFSDVELVYILKGNDAIHHFFRVITSLDSQIIGEPQITGQVKEAYESSHFLTYTDILINKMYNFGMQVEKEVRTKTYLGDGAVSVSFAGVELARKIFGELQNTSVLLVGAGETAELAAQHFAARDVSRMIFVNRTIKNARQLAKKFHGEAAEIDNLEKVLSQADIAITATSSEDFILTKDILESTACSRNYKPLFLLDLAMPRDIDPAVSDIDGIFLYNLDALQKIVDKNIEKRKKEIPKAEKIVENQVAEYIKWYGTLPVVKTIKQLSSYFEEIRDREFKRLKNRFSKESLDEAEYLSKSLMKKFLHHHIVTLRQSNKDPQRQKQHIDLVDEIYRLNGSEPKDDKKN